MRLGNWIIGTQSVDIQKLLGKILDIGGWGKIQIIFLWPYKGGNSILRFAVEDSDIFVF